jgi:hypothetical protein
LHAELFDDTLAVDGLRLSDAKGVDEIDQVRSCEVLATPVPLLRADEFLEYEPDVRRHVSEIDSFDAAGESPPCIDGAVRREDLVELPISRGRVFRGSVTKRESLVMNGQ